MNSYKTLNYLGFRAIIRSVANECIVDTPGPIEVGTISRRHWNALKEPSVNDLKTRVVKKKKKLRSKSLAAKKALLSQPATTEPPEGSQGQAGDQSLAAGLNPSEDSEVQVIGEVNSSNGHPSGMATLVVVLVLFLHPKASLLLKPPLSFQLWITPPL